MIISEKIKPKHFNSFIVHKCAFLKVEYKILKYFYNLFGRAATILFFDGNLNLILKKNIISIYNFELKIKKLELVRKNDYILIFHLSSDGIIKISIVFNKNSKKLFNQIEDGLNLIKQLRYEIIINKNLNKFVQRINF